MRGAWWAVGFLVLLVLVALLSGVIANDRPIVVRDAQGLRFPALGGGSYHSNSAVDFVVYAPVPFRAGQTDLAEPPYLPPLSRSSDGRLHWLGTDRLGRDTAAGLVTGTRVAVVVGLGSLLVALLIGLPLGALSGFYGNDRVSVPAYTYWSVILGLIVGVAYGVGSLLPLAPTLGVGWVLILVAVLVSLAVLRGVLRLFSRWVRGLRSTVTVPLDRGVMLLLGLTASVPGLILMIVALSFINRASIGVVVVVLGVLGWTAIARFLRSELMRIRELPYIAAAQVSGVGEWRLLVRHALPNALGPVSVVAAFLVGGSILAEAALSFLGIGLPADVVTWGNLLRQSRMQPSAWWLAVFPGILLTLTVLACNSLRKAEL